MRTRRSLTVPSFTLGLLGRALALALAFTWGGSSARADETEPPSDHKGQLGVSFDLGSGYRVLFPYQGSNTPECAPGKTTACTGGLPLFLDLDVTYGVSRKFDLLLDTRYGLGAEFVGTHAESVGFGFRYYPDPTGVAKMVAGVEVVADFTNWQAGVNANATIASVDLAAHPFGGLQLDFTRNVGAYVLGGVTAGFVRWLRFELDGFAGLQARFP